jgi:hypothetical protein
MVAGWERKGDPALQKPLLSFGRVKEKTSLLKKCRIVIARSVFCDETISKLLIF